MSKFQQSFRFTEDIYVDRTGSHRVLVKKDTEFTATLRPVLRRAPRFPHDPDPPIVEVPGMLEVESANIDILTGCLTSCIRTEQAVPTSAAKEI